MAPIKKSLIAKLGERITSGEDVVGLSKDTNVPLEDILAVAHGVYGVEVKRSGAFTEEQSDYLRSCIQHRVSYESIGGLLGVTVNPIDQDSSSPEIISGKGVQKSKPKLSIENKLGYEWFDLLDKLGERSSRDPDLMQESADRKIAFLISQFGKITGMYAALNANKERYRESSGEIMEGVRLAEALAQDIADYKNFFVDHSNPIFTQLKGPIEDMENDLENLRSLFSGRLQALDIHSNI